MHEMSLMDGILQRAEASLAPYKVEKVNSLTVRVGVLASIIPASFDFAFEALSSDTMLSGAELIMEKLPITAHCSKCGKEFTSEKVPIVCPECANTAVRILGGDEVYLINIDFEEEGESR